MRRPLAVAVWSLAFLPFVLVVIVHWSQPSPLDIADQFQYLLHARAIAEGRPYTDIGYIYTSLNPWLGPPAQPPGLPLMLAPLLAVLGTNWLAIKIAMLAFAAGFLLLVGRSVASTDDRYLAPAVVLLTSLEPLILDVAGEPLSDLPFCALVWAVIVLVDRPGPWGAGRIAAVAALGALAMTTRALGVAMIPALGAFTLLHRRRLGYGPAVVVLTWIGTAAVAAVVAPEILARILSWSFDPSDILWRIGRNLGRSVVGVHAILLYPFPWDRANDIYHLVADLLMVVGLLNWLPPSANRFVTLFAITYMGLLLLVPITAGRYLWPIAPLIVLLVLRGVVVAVSWVPWRRPWGHGLAVVTLVSIAMVSVARHVAEPPRPDPLRMPDATALYQYLARTASEQPARVMFAKPRLLAFATRIPAMPLIPAAPAPMVAELCAQRITHVVVGDFGLFPWHTTMLRLTLHRYPAQFGLAYRNATFEVFRFRGREPGGTCLNRDDP